MLEQEAPCLQPPAGIEVLRCTPFSFPVRGGGRATGGESNGPRRPDHEPGGAAGAGDQEAGREIYEYYHDHNHHVHHNGLDEQC